MFTSVKLHILWTVNSINKPQYEGLWKKDVLSI